MPVAVSLQAVTLKSKALLARFKEPPNQGHLVWVLVIFAVAVTLRSLWVAYTHVAPLLEPRLSDMQFYDGSAVGLVRGMGYISPWSTAATAQWPPGYSFLLAAFYKAFGVHVEIAWGANVVLGGLTCVALYFLGNLVGGKKVGIVAGLLLAVFPGHIFFSSLVLSETLFTFLVVVVLALVLLAARKSDTGLLRIIIIGMLVAAAALVRGQGLFLIVVAGLFWWLSTRDWARALQWATLVMVTAIVLIIPWSVRNYFAMKSFVFLSTNDGVNLYIGNYEGANGTFQFTAGKEIADRFRDLPPNEQEAMSSDAMLREGLKFMFTHPGKELQLVGSKLRYLYGNDEEALVWIDAPDLGRALDNRPMWADLANDFYFAVLVLSAGGLVAWVRQPRSALSLPLIFIGIFTLGQLAFFAVSRFHYPMLPSFCLLAAAGIVAGVEYVRSPRPARPKHKAIQPPRKGHRGKSKRRR